MSQLKMLSDQTVECIHWGEKAIVIAKELNDEEILSHAYNNVGTVQIRIPAYKQKGIQLLEQSLALALKNSFHEHAARAYTNLVSDMVRIKDYPFARRVLAEGLQYCEERELGSWRTYMLSWKARLMLETGQWDEAFQIAHQLINNEHLPPIVQIGALVVAAIIKVRRGETGVLPLLERAKAKAFEAMELQRILPALAALLEYEWITNERIVEKAAIETAIGLIAQSPNHGDLEEFDFWLLKARNQQVPYREPSEAHRPDNPYEQALTLFEGSETDKRKAISIVHQLGANAVYEKMKQGMRSSGIKSIPRGVRKTTQSNPALLTDREIGVFKAVTSRFTK